MQNKQEYEKLLELQNLTKESLELREQFRKENPFCGRLESYYQNNPIYEKQMAEDQRLFAIFKKYASEFRDYREKLARKYKFEFPIECYGLTDFAEYFYKMMEGEQNAK